MTGVFFLVGLFFAQVGTPTDSVVNRSLPEKSPGMAVLLSLLIPGGGQIYTQNYWKAVLIVPAEVGLGYFSYREHRLAQKALTAGDSVNCSRHQDRRNTFLFWTAGVIVFSMADAYVSAHMFGFDQQLRLSAGPGWLGVQMAVW